MTVTLYASTDAGAPTLPNANGSLNALLYACLVTGYGSKPGAGWTRPFTGSGLAAFLQGTGGHGCYLRVADNLTDGYGRRVQLRGYESMTAISTGTGAFPTTGQLGSSGANFHYHYAGGTNKPWVVIADSKFFHLIVDASDAPAWEYCSFGSFFSFKSGDTKPVILMAANDTAGPGGYQGYAVAPISMSSSAGIYCARSDTGATGAQYGHLEQSAGTSYLGQGDATRHPYPDRVTASLLMHPAVIWVDGYRRGRVPGLWGSFHTPAEIGGSGTTWSGTTSGALAGKQFSMIGGLASYISNAAYPIFETSDTWA